MSDQIGQSYRNYSEEKIKKFPFYLKLNHNLSLLFFDLNEISYDEFWEIIDNPNIQIPQKNYVIIDRYDDRLPMYELNHNPFTPELNSIIEEKYHLVEKYSKTQKDFKTDIFEYINSKTPKTVVLYLIDGLSYIDVANLDIDKVFKKITPVFVNGKTNTINGFKNIIYGYDDILIAKSLYYLGYDVYGLTYWNRAKNKTTDELFKYIPENNIFTHEMDLKNIIENNPYKKKYIQIYRMGLDEDAHKIRTTNEKLINDKINEIFENIKKLVEFLGRINESFIIYVISDHGIKWDFEKNYGKGAHGGISFEECFVPLIIIEG
ncbi:alkaline phosphatase family protein [Methanococcus aeolicus]|uniref:hypothetical protein n=1 Tax=Methanococcus aeolicus TaxID=42879 RepID=UPI0021C6F7CD|nr:hypothetical protein [Methanococcus aeolicus]UXM84775.1 hypothetical protein N6C89_00295 [Methanococcus aeolicus]